MKAIFTSSIVLFLFSMNGWSQKSPQPITEAELLRQNSAYLSLKLEMQKAIQKGNQYLASQQTEEGYWGDKTIPAYTALAITSAMRSPNLEDPSTPPHITKAYQWLLSQQKVDGGIYGKGLATYNTSLSITALVSSDDRFYNESILKARRFLINQQTDWDTRGDTDNLMDGGIGYGGSYPHSDMSNTYLSIEAIKLSETIAKDGGYGKQPDLNWEAALTFISRTQNLEETNDQPGIDNDGGFVYFPGDSKAGTREKADGRTALRSYGSMSYAGLLSFIHADLKADDPRVIAVKEWLNKNYTLDENPGLGTQGLYYYYQVMAKALSAANVKTLTTSDGKTIDWRRQLAVKVLSSQREDGSWINANSRWWENEPHLVTSYALLTLEQIYAAMPTIEE